MIVIHDECVALDVTVPDPENAMNVPIFDGSVYEIGSVLADGLYAASMPDSIDSDDMVPVTVAITDDGATIEITSAR